MAEAMTDERLAEIEAELGRPMSLGGLLLTRHDIAEELLAEVRRLREELREEGDAAMHRESFLKGELDACEDALRKNGIISPNVDV